MADTRAKSCSKCGHSKPLDAFNRNAQAKDGRRPDCRECGKQRFRRWWEKNKVRVRAMNREAMRDRRWSRGFVEQGREANRDYYQRNDEAIRDRRRRRAKEEPEKEAARLAVKGAIKRGRLHRPDGCQSCGHDFSFYRLEAHHSDYAKPLDVEWLCAKCHGARHQHEAA